MNFCRQGSAVSALSALVVAKMLALSLTISVAVALPESTAAATLKLPKTLTRQASTDRRPSTSRADSTRNASTRASRNSSGRTSLSIGGQSGAPTPTAWQQPRPALPADLRRGIAQGVALKPVPVKLSNAQPGELKLSRHLTRVSQPPGLGRVVSTQPLTPDQRAASTTRFDLAVYQRKLLRSGAMSPRIVPSDLKTKLNTAAAQSRAAGGRSAARVTAGTGQREPESPSNWQKPPPGPVDIRNSVAQGTALKPVPVKLPDAQPGELKLSRHLTRVSQPPGLGRVVSTQPLTPDQRATSTTRFDLAVYQQRLLRSGVMPPRIVPSDLKTKLNTASAQSRAASGRSAARVTAGTGQREPESPSNWQKPPPVSADLRNSVAQGAALKPVPVKLTDRQPGELKLSRHLTRVSQSQQTP